MDGNILDGFNEGPALGNTVEAYDGTSLGFIDGTVAGTLLDGIVEGQLLGNTVGTHDETKLGVKDGTMV